MSRTIRSSEAAAPVYPGDEESPAAKNAGTLIITQIVKTEVPLVKMSKGSATVGGFVDDYITDAILNHQEVLSITVNFTPAQWKELID